MIRLFHRGMALALVAGLLTQESMAAEARFAILSPSAPLHTLSSFQNRCDQEALAPILATQTAPRGSSRWMVRPMLQDWICQVTESMRVTDFRTLMTGWVVLSAAMNLLITGQVVSMQGITGAPLHFSLLVLVRTLPALLFSFAIGSYVDRRNIHQQLKIFEGLQIVPLTISLALGSLSLFPHLLRPWHLWVSSLLTGLTLSAQAPLVQMIMHGLVSRQTDNTVEERLRRNSSGSESLLYSAGRLAGAIVAVGVLALGPIVLLFGLNIAGVLFSVFKLRRLAKKIWADAPADERTDDRSANSAYRMPFPLAWMFTMTSVVVILSGIMTTYFAPLTAQAFAPKAARFLYGCLDNGWTLGALLSALAVAGASQKATRPSSQIMAGLVLSLCILVFDPSHSPVMSVGVSIIAAIATGWVSFTTKAWIQTHGNGALARNSSLYAAIAGGSAALGSFLAGVLAGSTPGRMAIILRNDGLLLMAVSAAAWVSMKFYSWYKQRQPEFPPTLEETIAILSDWRLEGGLHTEEGKNFESARDNANLQAELAEVLLSHRIMPTLDQLVVGSDGVSAIQKLRRNPKYRRAPIAFSTRALAEGASDPALVAIAHGANVLMGTGLTADRVRRIKAQFPHVLILAEVANENAEQDVSAAIASGVDGLLLKPYAAWNSRDSSDPYSLARIRSQHPKLLLMVARGVFESRIGDVLSSPHQLLAAVGLNAKTKEELEAQAGRYSAVRAAVFTPAATSHDEGHAQQPRAAGGAA